MRSVAGDHQTLQPCPLRGPSILTWTELVPCGGSVCTGGNMARPFGRNNARSFLPNVLGHLSHVRIFPVHRCPDLGLSSGDPCCETRASAFLACDASSIG